MANNIANKQKCSVVIVPLPDDQEEADLCMFLYARHAMRIGHETVILVSDENVLVLSLVTSDTLTHDQFYGQRFTSVTSMSHNFSVVRVTVVQGSLTGFQAYTGCYTIGAFTGRGKVLA